MSIVVIDDERSFVEPAHIDRINAIHIRTEKDALAFMWTHMVSFDAIEELWLDHDLGTEGGDIRSLVKGLDVLSATNWPIPIGKIFIHSANPIGADWMYYTLSKNYAHCQLVNAPEYHLIKA